MSPTEEIERDFGRLIEFLSGALESMSPEWVNAIGTLIGGIAVATGLFFANRQLTAWRTESLHKRGAEIAEDLLVSVYQVSEALKVIRSPLVTIPRDKADDKNAVFDIQYKRIVDQNEEFQALRLRQIRARAFFALPELDKEVDALFEVRNSVAIGLQMLADGTLDNDDNNPNIRRLIMETRREVSGSYSERDILGLKQLKAVERVEKILMPKIRLGSSMVP